jgi:hypothetical protein
MYKINLLLRSLILSSVILQAISFAYQATAQAVQRPSVAQHSTLTAGLQYTPPDQSAPRTGRSRGGASRGNCPATNLPLVSLAPSTADAHASLGLTTADHPSFWFYVPFALTAERPAEFSLLNADGNYLYDAVISNSQNQAGVIKVELPASTKSLAADQTYTWMFQVNCGISNPISTWGQVKRIAPDQGLIKQIQQATDREKAALYAEHGFWYEAVNTLAELRLANPTDSQLMADWQSLLQSAGLADVAEQPLLACCSAN